MKILISTGEVSGDVAGGLLTRAIRAESPDTHVFGIGGPAMASAGADVRCVSTHLGSVGVSEVFPNLLGLAGVVAAVRALVRDEHLDVAVLIGNDIFHVLLGRWLRARGVRTIAYFPPQVWVWRVFARPIARSFDAILTAFPDEQAVYARAAPARTAVTFVGHYLRDELTQRTAEATSRARVNLGVAGPGRLVALLPGSRGHEVRALLPDLVGAARLMGREDPGLRFLVPVAAASFQAEVEREVARAGIGERVRILDGRAHEAMVAADVVVLASGTASLEATLVGVPMVIVYKVSALSYVVIRALIACGFLESDTVGLPNLIVGRRVVPELIQRQVSAPAIANVVSRLLESQAFRENVQSALEEAAARISGGSTLARAAHYVLAGANAEATQRAARAPRLEAPRKTAR